MKGQPNDRAIILGQYILDNNATVRATAKKFGISKSTVHKDVSERLIKIQPQLYSEVKKILEKIDAYLVVVCGSNEALKEKLKQTGASYKGRNGN